MGGAKKDQAGSKQGGGAPGGVQNNPFAAAMGSTGSMPDFQAMMMQHMGGQPPATGGPTPMQPGANTGGFQMPNVQGGPGGAPMGPAGPQQRCPMCGR